MIVALHSAPEGFFKSCPTHSHNELCCLIQKSSSWGFKGFQVGPLSNFEKIDGKKLKTVFDCYSMQRNVHVGGFYEAKRLVVTEEEYEKAQKEIRYGIELCKEISSTLVSFHPPLFKIAPENASSFTSCFGDRRFLLDAKACFLGL